MKRRDFFRDVALLGVAGLALPSRAPWTSARAAARHGGLASPTRPFTIVVFGDSVMWGQGLDAPQKASSLVRSWVQSWMPQRTVQRFVFAHSGALLEPRDAGGPTSASAGETEVPTSFAGELPGDFPSVFMQLERARQVLPSRGVALDDVDLVLTNGGINDVNLRVLLNPGTTEATVRARTQRFAGMQAAFLPLLRGTFRNAKIALVGYFPVISRDSDPTQTGAWLGLLAGTALGAGGMLLTGAPVPPSAVITTAAVVSMASLGLMAQHSTAFVEESTAAMQAAVAQEERLAPGHAVFVDPDFGPRTAYAAPETLLFHMSESMSDPASVGRIAVCNAAAGPAPSLGASAGLEICRRASIGHPNVAGAARFANAIERELTRFLPEWLDLRRMTVELSDVPSMEPGVASPITVSVRDAVTAQPVNATVRFANKDFPANVPASVTACPGRTIGKIIGRATSDPVVQPTGACAWAFLVSACGYFDAAVSLATPTAVQHSIPAAPRC